MSLRKQITFFVLLYCLGVGLIVGLVQYFVAKDHLLTAVREKTSILARALAGSLNGEEHAALAHPGAAEDPRYIRALEYIRSVKSLFLVQSAAYIYTLHYDKDAEIWRYVLDAGIMPRDGVWVKTKNFGFEVNCDEAGQLRVIHAFKTNTANCTLRVADKEFDLHFEGKAPRQSLFLDGKKILEVREHAPLVLDTIAGEVSGNAREAAGEIVIAGRNEKVFLSFCAQGEAHSMPGERFVASAAFLKQCYEIFSQGSGNVIVDQCNENVIINAKGDIWGEVNFVAVATIHTFDGFDDKPIGLVCVDVTKPLYSSYYKDLLASMIATIVPLLIIVSIVFFIQGQRFIRPMFQLDKAMRQLLNNHFSTRLDLGNIREYARLSESFNLMTVRLAEYVEESKKSAAEVRDMEIARSIQDAFMEHEPSASPFFEIACRHTPRRIVGGDSFCFQMGDGNTIGVLVSDVTGHGVSAALISNMVRMAYDFGFSLASSRTDKLLEELNSALIDKCMGLRYVTACYTYLDFDRRCFSVSNAGHPPMMVYRGSEDKFDFFKPRGIPLGCFPEIKYESIEYALKSGDRIILYTDGISEAQQSGGGQLFGQSRFLEVIRGSRSLSAAGLAERVLSEVQTWRHSEDDMTIVVIDIV